MTLTAVRRDKRRRRIVFLIRDLNIGGAQRQVIELASAMDPAEWRVKVLTFYGDGPLLPDLLARGVAYESLDKQGRWDMIRFWFRLLNAVRKERPDVLHSYLGTENMMAVSFKPLLPRMRIVWGLRSSQMDSRQYERIAGLLTPVSDLLSRLPDMIISNSTSSVVYHATQGYPADRMIVIPNGIDSDRFKPDAAARQAVRDEWSITDDQVLVGIVGRLDPKKDYPNFLRAAALIAAERDDVRFVCVGPGPESYRAELEALATELGLGDRVTWAGGRLDMPQVYNALDVLASSSAWGEGFPNVVAEAMASGVPCVVAEAGDSAVVVGDTGAVCLPQDADDLARALRTQITTPVQMREAGARARARILSEFSVARLARTTSRCLAELIDTPHWRGGSPTPQ